jgi:hypothetical protein
MADLLYKDYVGHWQLSGTCLIQTQCFRMSFYSHLQTIHCQYANNFLLLFFMLVLVGTVGMEPTEVLSGPHITIAFVGSWVQSQPSPLISKQRNNKNICQYNYNQSFENGSRVTSQSICIQHLLQTVDSVLYNIRITRQVEG